MRCRGVVRVDRRRAPQLDLERLVRDPLDVRGVQRVQALDARRPGVLEAQAAQVGGGVQGCGSCAAQTAAAGRSHRTTRDSFAAAADTVTWIAAGSRTQAMRS